MSLSEAHYHASIGESLSECIALVFDNMRLVVKIVQGIYRMHGASL